MRKTFLRFQSDDFISLSQSIEVDDGFKLNATFWENYIETFSKKKSKLGHFEIVQVLLAQPDIEINHKNKTNLDIIYICRWNYNFILSWYIDYK